MRPSTVRNNTQSGVYNSTTNGQFATYNDIQSAVDDILLYMAARKFPKDEMTLYEFVSLMQQKGYFGTESISSYYSKVKAWLER
jgi:hypothetical protein